MHGSVLLSPGALPWAVGPTLKGGKGQAKHAPVFLVTLGAGDLWKDKMGVFRVSGLSHQCLCHQLKNKFQHVRVHEWSVVWFK